MNKSGNLEGQLTAEQYRIFCFIQNNAPVNRDFIWQITELEEEVIESALKVLENDEGLIYKRGGDNWYETCYYTYDKEVE